MTVSQPDGDGQSSSLALLIWLMMTMMVMMMMMPVFLPATLFWTAWAVHHHYRHCYLFWMATQRQRDVPEKKRQGEARGGVGVWEDEELKNGS